MNSSAKEQISAKYSPKRLMFCNLEPETLNLELSGGAEFLTKAVLALNLEPGTRNLELGTSTPASSCYIAA